MKPDYLQKAHRNLAHVMSNEQVIRKEAKGASYKKSLAARARLQKDIDAYLAKGGRIETLASGADLPSMAAMTGEH